MNNRSQIFSGKFTVQRPLAFMHVPKTGGMSLREIIRDQFEEEDRSEVYDGEIDRLQTPNCLAFLGHFSRSNLEEMPVNPQIITVLRDPIDRVLSCYYYWLEMSDEQIEAEGLIGPKLAKTLEMQDFLRLQEPRVIRGNFLDVQTRMFLPKHFFDDDQLIVDDATAVKEALEYLLSMYACGTLAQLDRFIWEIGLSVDSIPKINRNTNRPESSSRLESFSPEVRDAILDLTQLDRQLYAAYNRIQMAA